ncbi:PAS domain S-box protein [Methanoregula sp.]|jgi:PAS domain S-box-containing protein|uniref:PAS domain-containing sensor histidine kinase n=1 Tax=Methanoregula sp. TaxID=2052170 RepID=UPI003C1A25BB
MTTKKPGQTGKKTPPRKKKAGDSQNVRPSPEPDFREIFDTAGIASVVIGEDMGIIHANSKFVELSGYTLQDLEGKKRWTDFVAKEDIEKLEIYHTGLTKPGGWAPLQYSLTFTGRDGNKREMSVVTGLIPRTQNVVVSLVDVTARKKFEAMIRINEERYRTLTKNISSGVFRTTCDHPGRFVWANPAFLDMFGIGSLGELLKYHMVEIYADPADRDLIIADLRKDGCAKNPLLRARKIDGTPLFVSLTSHVKRNTGGAIEWIDGTVENITDLVHAKAQSWELMAAASSYGIITTDREGVITAFNVGAERMLGYRPVEVTGRATPLVILTGTEIAARSRKLSDELGKPVIGFDVFSVPARISGSDEREWTCIRKDGTHISVSLSVAPLKDTGSSITGYLFVAQEITAKKRVEESFRVASLQMSGVIYNLPDPTFAIDREGKVIAWNRAIEELTGVRAVEILGQGNYAYAIPFYGNRRPMLVDLVFTEDRKIEGWDYTGIERSRNSLSAETSSMKPRGRTLIMRGVAAPIYDESGEIAGVIESLSDVTDLRRREHAIRDTLSRYQAILDYTGSATAIIEQDSTISYINPEFEKITGYVKEEVEGKKKWMDFVIPEDVDRMRLYQSRVGQITAPSTGEFRFIRWDGQVRSGYITLALIPDMKKFVFSILDITDKIQAEDACQRANKKLNFFNAITRHEILNHLTVLKGNLELALAQVSEEAARATLEKNLAATNAIQAQIMFTRDYQDIGLQPPEWQDVGGAIRRACAGLRLGEVGLEADIQSVEVYADKLLERVFFHLADNAVRYGEKITRIHFSCDESFEELLITCEDDGIGIPPGAKEKIFNHLFFRNVGLDMYLSREILSLTGITIRETGTFGKGARFEIRVPKGAYRFTGSH